jgi:hypothetical protein
MNSSAHADTIGADVSNYKTDITWKIVSNLIVNGGE